MCQFIQVARFGIEMVRLSGHRSRVAGAIRRAGRSTAIPLSRAERNADKLVCGSRRYLAGDRRTVPFGDEGEVVVSEFAAIASKSRPWTRFLFSLVRNLNARSVVELGSAAGVSGTAIAAGLAYGGRLWTIEARVAPLARDTFARAGLSDRVEVVDGWFDDVYLDVLAAAAPVSLVFIDGNHYGEPTLRYFEQALPYLAEQAVVVFDDIHWSREMEAAWDQLKAHPRAVRHADLRSVGVIAV